MNILSSVTADTRVGSIVIGSIVGAAIGVASAAPLFYQGHWKLGIVQVLASIVIFGFGPQLLHEKMTEETEHGRRYISASAVGLTQVYCLLIPLIIWSSITLPLYYFAFE